MEAVRFSSLNEDVLQHIASFLNSADAVRLSRTCRKVHWDALHHALSEVILDGDFAWRYQMPAALSYYMLDHPDRIHWLRMLEIHNKAWEDHTDEFADEPDLILRSAEPLADLLSRAVCLRHLHLGHIEALVATTPRIASALVTLPDLVHLGLEGDHLSTVTVQIIRELQSRLRSLAIRRVRRDGDLRDDLPIVALLAGAAHLHESLEALQLVGFKPSAEDADKLPVFRNVRRLAITRCKAPLSMLERLFPNATLLTWENVFNKWSRCYNLRYASLGTLRLASQCASVDVPQLSPEVQGVLAETMPTIISFSTGILSQPAYWQELVGRCTPHLRALELELRIDDSAGSDLTDRAVWCWMEIIPPLLSASSISYLEIHLSLHLRPSQSLLHSIKHDFPALLARTIPSLQNLSICCGVHTRSGFAVVCEVASTSWWRIARKDGARAAVPEKRVEGEKSRSIVHWCKFHQAAYPDGSIFSRPG